MRFQMFEYRWKKQPLMSAFGKVAEAELISASSKLQRTAFGPFSAGSSWFCVSEKDLSYIFLVLLGNKPKIRFAIISSMNGMQLEKYLCASAESPITDHSTNLAKSWTAWSVSNIKIQSSLLRPLSKSKACSPLTDSWYSRGNTGISVLISGLRGWCLSFLWLFLKYLLTH